MEIQGFEVDDYVSRKPTSQDSLLVTFSYKAEENKAKSIAEGRPIFDQKEFVKIQIPGSRDEIYREVTDKDRDQFASRYKAFQNGHIRPAEGLPLEEWPVITTSQIAELKALGVYTLEQVASLPDSRVTILGLFGNKVRQQARDTLEAARSQAPIHKLRTENEALRAHVAKLSKDVAELSAGYNSLIQRMGQESFVNRSFAQPQMQPPPFLMEAPIVLPSATEIPGLPVEQPKPRRGRKPKSVEVPAT